MGYVLSMWNSLLKGCVNSNINRMESMIKGNFFLYRIKENFDNKRKLHDKEEKL